MRNRTPWLLKPAVRQQFLKNPSVCDHLLANLTAVGVLGPSLGLSAVRTFRSDSLQIVKKFLLQRGTTLSGNTSLRTNEINDLPLAGRGPAPTAEDGPEEAVMRRGGRHDVIGLAELAVDLFETFQESRYRCWADGEVPVAVEPRFSGPADQSGSSSFSMSGRSRRLSKPKCDRNPGVVT